MKIKEWVSVIAAILVILSAGGAVGVWAADQRYVVAADLSAQLLNMQIADLDNQITLLQIKATNNEASQSEKIYLESLKQQLRALKSNVK